MATIWGIAVIGTRRAPIAPTSAPTGMPTARIQTVDSPPSRSRNSVMKTQPTTIAMPVAASRLPRRAETGDERNFRPRMKVTEPTR